ncbi:MAG TPA: aldose 1-epimerase family protein [Streptosporangiaceae bacterium]|nr:aldose 1-epimerase family protein [Streptosporangiaceae bacterium]
MFSVSDGYLPLTGTQFDISAGDYSATVTELGAGLRALRHRGQPVVAEYGPDVLPPGAAGQLLCPWPNRVNHGTYTIAGTTYQLDLSEPGNQNAIHGLTRWSGWSALRQSAHEISLRHVLLGHQGYPFCMEFEAGYRLDAAAGLQVTISARNIGAVAAPYGTGSHPYLTAGTPEVDECQLTLPAGRWLPVDERGIPAGPAQDVTGSGHDFRTPRPLAGVVLDHALTGLERGRDGRAVAVLAGGGTEVALWAGPGYRWLQAFTGDTLDADRRRRALAIEPMTCPPNAFASGEDLLMLEPGDSVTHTWGVVVTTG